MQFWFVCCVLLFAVFHAYAWIAHRALALPQLGLPWAILGGVGLAIASNYNSLKAIDSKISPGLEKQSKQPLQPASSTESLPQVSLSPETVYPHSTVTKPSGISFEISSKALEQKQT